MPETRNMKYVISLPLGQFIASWTNMHIVGTTNISDAKLFTFLECILIQNSLKKCCKCIFFEFESYIPTWRK